MSKKKIKQKREKARLNQYYYQNVCNYSGIERSVHPFWELLDGTFIARNILTIKHDGSCFSDELSTWIAIHLPNIERIYIVNAITVSNNIGIISSLKGLCITGSEFKHLPDGISKLSNLESLDFSRSSVEKIPDSFCKLYNLKYLIMHNTQIKEIPEYIGEFENLFHLNLSNLVLNFLPGSLINLNLPFVFDSDDWKLINGINLYQTTIKEQDISIFHKDREFVIEFFNNSSQVLNEGKVIFLGNGFVGKTFIIERICNNNNKLPEDFTTNITEGIRVVDSIFNEDFKIKFWDFGGEQIAHSMHRCFLTQRTIYVVVLSAREENCCSILDYWMRTIDCFVKDSPVIIVVNKIDEFPYYEINEVGLKKKYSNVLKIFFMSALKDSREKFSVFSDYLLQMTKTNMKNFAPTFPSRWIPIKEDLENMSENYITGDFFTDRCNYYDRYLNDNKRKELLSWFNDLGIVFSYSLEKNSTSNIILNNYHILKPIWLINAVYAIIFNAKHSQNFRKGILYFDDIYDIIITNKYGLYKDIDYNEKEIPYILEVMRKFKISHKITDRIEFIPSVCTSSEPDDSVNYEIENVDLLKYEIEYEYLPNDIIHRFIIENYTYIKDKNSVWLCGAKFNYEHLACEAVLKKESSSNRIIILIKRLHKSGEARALLRMIKEDFKKIHEMLSIPPKNEYIFFSQEGKTFRIGCDFLLKCLKKGILTSTLEDDNKTDVYSVDFTKVLSSMFEQSQLQDISKEFPFVCQTKICQIKDSNVQFNSKDGIMINYDRSTS